MVGQVLIVFGCYLSNFLQIPPRAGGKIMVFRVIPHVQIGDIPPSNVVIGLLPLDELIMLCDDMYGSGVGSYRAGPSNKGEDECVAAPVVVYKVVGGDDEDVVEDLVNSDRRVLHKDGSECVENLNYAVEKEFIPGVVDRQFGFPGQRQIWVCF